MNKFYKKIIAANWKMNKTPEESQDFIKKINNFNNSSCEIIIFAPYINLPIIIKENYKNKIKIGAQNCHHEQAGAFTGEISTQMLFKIGVTHVIIGHSERRNLFHETDKIINKKIKASLETGLKPIICIGENSEQKDLEITEEIISIQIKSALYNINNKYLQNIIIAYEPIWAIGTGKTATADQANINCKKIKFIIQKKYGQDLKNKIPVLYGGSVNSKNSQDFLNQPEINGILIGGASLDIKEFSKIINFLNFNS